MAFGSLVLAGGFAAARWCGNRRRARSFPGWLGRQVRRGAGDRVRRRGLQADRIRRSRGISRFIEQVRSIPADPVVVRQNWLRAYDYTTDRGAIALNDYARGNDPFAKVGSSRSRSKSQASFAPRQESFRIAWLERRYENGQLSGTERWTAILTIVIQQPRSADKLRANPLGVFVNAINWSKEMG